MAIDETSSVRILVTFPGRYGDLLWALPAIRALSRRVGGPIDLVVATPFANLCPLIAAQPYIGHCVAINEWETQDTAPISPRVPPTGFMVPMGSGAWPAQTQDGGWKGVYNHVFHLGYRAWPKRPLPFETLDCLNEQLVHHATITDEDLCLSKPWITVGAGGPTEIAIGFTDEHFELKVGLVTLLARLPYSQLVLASPRSRWQVERPSGSYPLQVGTWEESAASLRNADVALCCCSALHVLAVAVGTPVVVMEPEPMRHHPIFYPLGWDGPQVTIVKGNDGKPTFDARHVADTLERVLNAPR